MAAYSFVAAQPLLLSLFLGSYGPSPAFAQQGAPALQAGASGLTLKTTVRRVVLDVVVSDAHGNPVSGLAKEDFSISEDGQPQTALSFESTGFNPNMDYLPPKLPAEPPNTFVNLPATPEKGPLYVLLYDLVNMDNEDQMAGTANQHEDQIRGRQQLAKFIQSKPEGARFAIFVWSDGLHLLQGFTSDKQQLYAVVDPTRSRPHVPKVFLMGENSGRADAHATLSILNQIGSFLDGLPGRKNLIWFSGAFPLSLYPGKDEGPGYIEQTHAMLNLLARNQIAIYPVDVRGVVTADWHSTAGITDEGAVKSDRYKGGTSADTQQQATQKAAAKQGGSGVGSSLLRSSYFTMDEIARETGGRAFYSTNDVAAALTDATQTGTSYYTLSYAPPAVGDTTRLRSIHVDFAKKGYQLAYRRAYYNTDTRNGPSDTMRVSTKALHNANRVEDTLDAYMRHGAPVAHQLIFAAHVNPVGNPVKGTAEQMTQISLYAGAWKNSAPKRLPPIPLQHLTVDFTVMAHQLQSEIQHRDGNVSLNLELATAAYNSDGLLLNSVVDNASSNNASSNGAAPQTPPAKVYRAQQEIDVPLNATYLRIAIQDANTGRVGSMEVRLPLTQ